MLIQISEGVRVNIEGIRGKVRSLITRMESKIKPLVDSMAQHGNGRTLNVVKSE